MAKKVDTSQEVGQAPAPALYTLADTLLFLLERAGAPQTVDELARLYRPVELPTPGPTRGELQAAVDELARAGRVEVRGVDEHGDLVEPRYIAQPSTPENLLVRRDLAACIVDAYAPAPSRARGPLSELARTVLAVIQEAPDDAESILLRIRAVRPRSAPDVYDGKPLDLTAVEDAIDQLVQRGFIVDELLAKEGEAPRYMAQPSAPELLVPREGVPVDELLARTGRVVASPATARDVASPRDMRAAAGEPFETVIGILAAAAEPMTFEAITDAVEREVAPAGKIKPWWAFALDLVGGPREFVRAALDRLTADGRVEAQLEQLPGLYRLTDAAVASAFSRLEPLWGASLERTLEHLLEQTGPAPIARLVELLASMPSPPTELAVTAALARLQTAGRVDCVDGDPPRYVVAARAEAYRERRGVEGVLEASADPMTFEAICVASMPDHRAGEILASLEALVDEGRVLLVARGSYKHPLYVHRSRAAALIPTAAAMRERVERVLANATEPLTIPVIASHVWPAVESAPAVSPVFLRPVERALDALADQGRAVLVHDDEDPGHERYRLARPGEADARRAAFADTVDEVLARAGSWLTVEQLVDRITNEPAEDRVAPPEWYAAHVTQALEVLMAAQRVTRLTDGDAPAAPRYMHVRRDGPDAPTPPAPDVDVETALAFLDRRIVSILARTLDGARALAECAHREQLTVDAATGHEHQAPAGVCVDCGAVKLEGKDWRPPRLVAQLVLARSGKVSQ